MFNVFTHHVAMRIDNDEIELHSVLSLARTCRDKGELALKLEKRYGRNVVPLNSFQLSLSSDLLNQAFSQVQWHELAEHYLSKFQ